MTSENLKIHEFFFQKVFFSYQVLENIRYLLYQYSANTSLYVGQRYTRGVTEFGHYEGYMQGGGYILSKKALTKLVAEFTRSGSNCSLLGGFQDQSCEDKYVGDYNFLKLKFFYSKLCFKFS